MSDFIRDGWVIALQLALSTVGYIRLIALESKKPNLVSCEPGAKPLNISFEPNPDPDPLHPRSHPFLFPAVGGDIVIAPPTKQPAIQHTQNVITTATDAFEANLQIKELRKLMWSADTMPDSDEKIPGERVIGELVNKSIVLIPRGVDPHGIWGPLMGRLLFNLPAHKDLRIPPIHPNASRMLRRSYHGTRVSCGILTTADINWQCQSIIHPTQLPSPSVYVEVHSIIEINLTERSHIKKQRIHNWAFEMAM